MSTPESQALRDGIRDGSIRCRRPSEGGTCDGRLPHHEPGCTWNRAIIRIYELERAAEGIEQTDQVVDWPTLIGELRKRGYTLEAIAEHAGLTRQAVSSYVHEVATPLHSKGEKIVEFWLRVTSKERNEIPRREPLPSVASLR